LNSWPTHARETLAQLKTDGVIGKDVALDVATGNGGTTHSTQPTGRTADLLAIGTSPVGGIAGCFLRLPRLQTSCGNSPVPVLVLPGSTSRCAVEAIWLPEIVADPDHRPARDNVRNLSGRHES